MAWTRPTLGELWDRIGALWRATFPGADTNLRKSPDRAFIGVIARSTDEDLTFLDWMVLQLFPFSAQGDYLERWAAWRGVKRKAATAGSGIVSFAGGTPGQTADAGTRMQSTGGVTVALVADCTIGNDGTASVAVSAVIATGSTAGAGTNLGVGAVLTFVSTPAGFPDTGTVTAAFAGGADAEAESALRLRTQRRYAQPSFGGNEDDWQNAALAVAGVTRVFTAPALPTPGAVTIWPLFDDLRNNGIPVGIDAWYRPGTGPSAGTGGAGDQLVVLQSVLATRPICAHVYVRALATQGLDLTISGLVTSSDAVKTAIAAEIATLLKAKAAPSGSGYTIYLEWIVSAIAQASGVRHFDLVSPAADIVLPPGAVLVPGVNTYE